VTTFRDLGLDLPLFAAPVREASRYSGAQSCTLCRLPQPHCFALGIGDDIVLSCSACHATTALDTHSRADGTCSGCGTILPFPEAAEKVYTCFDCLRAGRAAFTQDTELGMVRWEDAQLGLTFGVPMDSPPELPGGDTNFTVNDDGWWQAHLLSPS
jgi:hypothetical protein